MLIAKLFRTDRWREDKSGENCAEALPPVNLRTVHPSIQCTPLEYLWKSDCFQYCSYLKICICIAIMWNMRWETMCTKDQGGASKLWVSNEKKLRGGGSDRRWRRWRLLAPSHASSAEALTSTLDRGLQNLLLQENSNNLQYAGMRLTSRTSMALYLTSTF